MKPKSSGNAPAIGTSNNGPGPSGSMVRAPLVEKKIAICDCAPTATAPGAPTRFVRNVCGFLGNVGFARNARSLRKNVARALRSPERISAVAVGLGTVLSPRANWMITGLARSPGRGDLFMNGAQATGSPACPSHLLVSSTVWIAIAPGTLLVTGARLRNGLLSLKKSGGPALSKMGV